MQAARLAAALAIALAASGAAAQEPARERPEAARLMQELMAGKGPVGGEFTLRGPGGKAVRLADFRGRLVLLYFGYTTCPDVCPTDLLAIGKAIDALGARGGEVQPLFVTLDPERDTRPIIDAYARNFHPSFVALTGTPAQVKSVAAAYKVFHEKVPGKDGFYFIDHAAFTYLIDRRGRYVGVIPPGTPAERFAAVVGEELSRPGR